VRYPEKSTANPVGKSSEEDPLGRKEGNSSVLERGKGKENHFSYNNVSRKGSTG